MKGQIVRNNELSLEYYTHGAGNQTLVCFHGHGRSVEDFYFLKSNNRKLILIVLPHHGHSVFPENRTEKNPLTIHEFDALLRRILDKEKAALIHFVGFSQGGRFALALIPFYGKRLLSVKLISPDGMDYYSFYNRASRFKPARLLFKKWESNPKLFIVCAKIGLKLRIIRPKVFSFIQLFATNKTSFKRASLTWRSFRNIQPDLKAIKRTIEDNEIIFHIIMGKYDQVIRTQQAERFLLKIDMKASLIEIECGHDFFKESNLFRLKKAINV
jgi:pimeloyl-ACP methyl ester carboxylesterase